MLSWVLLSISAFHFCPEADARESVELRISSYNVRGLPFPLVRDRGQYRHLGRLLAESRRLGKAPHVLALQEAWVFSRSARQILKHSGYPYVAWGDRTRPGRALGSGLVILSEFPIELVNKTRFSDCVSWDCASTKGVLHARVRVPGAPLPVDLYNTHLNSDPDTDPFARVEDCRTARMSQVSQMADFIGQTEGSGSILVILGDLNATSGSQELSVLAERTHARNAMLECGQNDPSCSGVSADDVRHAIDHQLLRPGSAPGLQVDVRPVRWHRSFSERFRGAPLSDHLSVDVTYRLEW